MNDAPLLAKLARGAHTLRFEVREGPAGHGLAIYGPNTGRGEGRVNDGGPLRLRLLAE